MVKLILHRFGSKKVGRNNEPDFDVEETKDNGKRQYIFSVQLDHNDKLPNGDDIPNTSQRNKLKGKSLGQLKALLKSKPKSQAFKTDKINGRRHETFTYCDHCVELIEAEVNKI